MAYPHKVDNPIHRAMPALHELASHEWDQGNDYFPPTSMQISDIHAGNGTNNVIPGELQALFCDDGLPAAEPTCIYALRLEREASSRTRLLLAFLRERFGFPPPWDQALQQRLGER